MEQGVDTPIQSTPSVVPANGPRDRHVRQKVGNDTSVVSPALPLPQLTKTLPMSIGAAPEGRSATAKAKLHNSSSSSSVSPSRARAVRSAVGKAVIGSGCDWLPKSPVGRSLQKQHPATPSVCRGDTPALEVITSGMRFGFISPSTSFSNNSSSSSPLSSPTISSTAGGDAHVAPFTRPAGSAKDGEGIARRRLSQAADDNSTDSEDRSGTSWRNGTATPDGSSPLGSLASPTTSRDSLLVVSQRQEGGVPDTLPLKRPAPEEATPTLSNGSLSIGDHISAARSAFSAGGSISFGLHPDGSSAFADRATLADRAACQDTAASPLSRVPAETAVVDDHPGCLPGTVTTTDTPADREDATGAMASFEEHDSPDSALHALKLACLRLTADSAADSALPGDVPANKRLGHQAVGSNRESDSSKGSVSSKDSACGRESVSGNDDLCRRLPSNLTKGSSMEARLSSASHSALPKADKDWQSKEAEGALNKVPTQRQTPLKQTYGGQLHRSFSDPSGSRTSRQTGCIPFMQESVSSLRSALQQWSPTAVNSEQQSNSHHGHSREADDHGLSRQSSSAADVGASLSRMLLRREDQVHSPSASQHHQSAMTPRPRSLHTAAHDSRRQSALAADGEHSGTSAPDLPPPLRLPDTSHWPVRHGGALSDDIVMQLASHVDQPSDTKGRYDDGSSSSVTQPQLDVATATEDTRSALQHLAGKKRQQSKPTLEPLVEAAYTWTDGATRRQRKALATLLVARGRPREALELLEPLLRESPLCADLLRHRGECLAAVGNNVGAFASFASALAADSNHVDTLTSCGRLYKGRGLLSESVASYKRALAIRPDAKDIARELAIVLTDRGTQEKQSQTFDKALESYLEAAQICPQYAPAIYNVGVMEAEGGRFDEAIRHYREAIASSPAYPEAWCNLGVIFKNQGRLKEAVEAYEKALAGAPNFDIVRTNLAIAIAELATYTKSKGNLIESITMYDRALGYNPQYPDALYNLGVACGEAGKTDRALFAYEMAAALNPTCAEALNNIGVIHRERGNMERAAQCYTAALQIRPNFPQGLNNLAVVYTAQGRVAEALQLLQGALLAAPDYVEAHNNLGVLHRDIGNVPEAIRCYDRCLELCPETRNAGQNRLLALNYIHSGEERLVCAAHESWGDHFQSLFTPLPPLPPPSPRSRPTTSSSADDGSSGDPAIQKQRPVTLRHSPQWTEQSSEEPDGISKCEDSHIHRKQIPAQNTDAASVSATIERCGDHGQKIGHHDHGQSIRRQNREPEDADALPSKAQSDKEGQKRSDATPHLAERSGSMWAPVVRNELQQISSGVFSPHRLTVGYLSADLFTHSVSYFAEAPLTHHDSKAVRVIVYSCVAKGDDPKTAKLVAAVRAAGGTWRDVGSLSEAELAGAIRADGVDVLVELGGHTANNRLGTMAMRPAPVQVTWIGYPNSTGLKAVDYRLTDATCDPIDTQQTFVEELVRLQGCFLCYSPADDAPSVAPCPAAAAGFVTFGSFNNLAKITPQVLQVWARILHAVPASRLLLKNKPYACESTRNRTFEALQRLGIARIRVDLLPLAVSTADHLETYNGLDISLDPFPYAGTTTTCESLFMGVPCVTMSGKCHANNVGVSLLTAIKGLTTDWVAHTEEEYIALSIAAASDVPKLVTLRGQLRERIMCSSLADGHSFTRRLETTFSNLWDHHVQGGTGFKTSTTVALSDNIEYPSGTRDAAI